MLIDEKLLDEVTRKAKESDRLRMNHNLHDSLEAKAQRLLNALEPGTLLPIHRHRHTAETYIVLRGAIKVLFYDAPIASPEPHATDATTPQDSPSTLSQQFIVSPKDGVHGLHIPAGQWHTLEVLESGTVIFEVKDGPYTPLEPEDMLLPASR